jgi:hypothetical protein
MKEFHDRRRLRKLLHSRYAIAVLILMCLFLANAVWSVYGKYERSKVIEGRAKAELAQLEARQKELTISLADLNTDLGRERELRERFGAVGEGEKLIVLVDDKEAKKAPQIEDKKSLWQRFTELFTRD